MKSLYSLLFLFTLGLTSAAQAPNYIPTEGLVGWWPLNGSAMDDGSFENHGTVSGAVETTNRYNEVSGAMAFDGIDDHIVIPDAPSLQITENLTISLWYMTPGPSGNYQTFLTKRSGGQWPYSFGLSHYYGSGGCPGELDKYITGRRNGSSQYDIRVTEKTYVSNQWTHAAMTIENNVVTFYENGLPIGSTCFGDEFFVSPIDQGAPLTFGTCNCGLPEMMTGSLDDIGIWNRALDEAEVQALFLSSAPVNGCIDLQACNYNSEANVDDGSCIYPPTIELGDDIQACEDSVVLDAGAGFDFYEWNTGETTQTILVTEVGEYAVSASNVIENNHALQFNGTDATGAPAEPILFGTESFSVSVDCKLNAFKGNDSEPYSYIIGHPLTQGTGDHGFKIQTAGTSLNGGFQAHINDEGTTHFNVISFDNGTGNNVELDQWYDLTIVVDRDNAQFSFYVDGLLIETQTIHPDFGNVDHPNGMSLGVQSIHGSSLLNGDLDNLQIWNIALSAEDVAHLQTTVPSGSEMGLVGYWNFEEGEGDEANDLSHMSPNIALNNIGWTDNTPAVVFDASCAASDTIQVSWLIHGCTDPEACNYVEDASCDDGTCASCEALQTACGPGTIWDAEMQMCLSEIECDSLYNPDVDFDGFIGLTDILGILSHYNNEWPPWECGDPIEYQGYDYETTQIGDQCWFAENLRSERYSNDTDILTGLDDAEWTITSTGAKTIYGEGTVCDDFSPDLDACDPLPSLNQYGYLYNWFAIDNPAAICPQGWHVPSKLEWEEVISFLGGPEEAGPKMRTVSGFETNDGNNLSGFGGLPGGLRAVVDGSFDGGGRYGNWWSSTPSGSSHAWYLNLTGGDNAGLFFGDNYQKQLGHSVRCIKDAE